MNPWVVTKALEVLRSYPLCDRCLGRLFARLGYGWSNKERGDAIKRVLVMELHKASKEGSIDDDELKEVLANIGFQAGGLFKLIKGGELQPRQCYICGGVLDEVVEKAYSSGISLLKAYDIRRFVVGVKVEDRGIIEREEELKRRFGLGYGESVKSEVRREVGKRIRDSGLAEVDFSEPEATLLVYLPSGEVDIQVNSYFVKGVYWKLARNISQAYWPSPEGPRYFSVEQALWPLLKVMGAESVVVHAAGREDVDARMLGSGRPLIVEVKRPRRRRLDVRLLEEEANKGGKGLVRFRFVSTARRAEVRLYKEETARVRKIYRALVAVDREVDERDIELVESEFRNRVVLQRTPKRVAHRRPDIVRRRTVYSVRCSRVVGGLMECLIEAEGGLYIKELVSGDDGRTSPSFAEVLGSRAECVELDVVWVEREGVSEQF